MNPVLRAVSAEFTCDGVQLVAPFSLTVAAGADYRLVQPSARAASIAARMCAAIVKPTGGTIFVGEYETRLQPPQAKRLVGFVDAGGFAGDAHAFNCEVAFRAEVWGIDRTAARARAQRVLAGLTSVADGAFARAVALALVAEVALVVLDQPPQAYLDGVRRIVPAAGILVSSVTLGEPPVAARALAAAGRP